MNSILRVFVLLAAVSACFAAVPAKRWELVPDSDGQMHLVDLNTVYDEVSPAYVPETDIIFSLCTARNPTECQIIQWSDMNTVRNSNFDASRTTIFTVHGWGSSGRDGTNVLTRERFFRLGDYNMITVDWGAGAQTNNYITARNRVGPTGAVVARFIDNLHEAGLIRFADTFVIGHSLGAHIVGMAGKAVTRGRIQKIIGLDPAGPLFNFNDPSTRLHATDGVYVEAIHTNAGELGIREPIVQADFYPNFGRMMPGCEGDVDPASCSHQRVTDYYTESILSPFTATQCTSFDEVGNGRCTPTGSSGRLGGAVAKPGLSGVFYLTTNAQSPFSRG